MHYDKKTTQTTVRMMGSARVPTEHGDFRLCLYRGGGDNKEHLAIVRGNVAHGEGVLTRLHSECFTGDVMGSLRCDCGPQLQTALAMIAQAGRGVVLYLRQEGRGIGLLNKLRAYGLQDEGYDTVDANLRLGFAADAREYGTAARILRDLGVRSVDLITNNPAKIDGLAESDMQVRQRVALEVPPNAENVRYLSTKAARMDHMLTIDEMLVALHHRDEVDRWLDARVAPADRPMVTLSYAQSLDGSIAREAGTQLALSGEASMALTHRLRAWHDAILVGIGTVLSDDPRLTVRLVAGQSPRPVVVDSTLRFPANARMCDNERQPWIVAGPRHDRARRQALEAGGVEVLEVAEGDDGLDLGALLATLHARGVQRLMVEGGARILNAFMRRGLVDNLIVTVAPTVVGGVAGIERGGHVEFPALANAMWHKAGNDMVLFASTS